MPTLATLGTTLSKGIVVGLRRSNAQPPDHLSDQAMPKFKPLPPLEELFDAFDFYPETGLLLHKHYKSGRALKGARAGTVNKKGYRVIRLRSTCIYQEHRVVYYMYHKKDPGQYLVDHINRIKTDNRISNLRLATDNTNQHNRKARGWHKHGNRYQACIRVDKRLHHLGTFDTPEEARAAYVEAAKLYHKDYACFDEH